jgi:hypothetical protein
MFRLCIVIIMAQILTSERIVTGNDVKYEYMNHCDCIFLADVCSINKMT